MQEKESELGPNPLLLFLKEKSDLKFAEKRAAHERAKGSGKNKADRKKGKKDKEKEREREKEAPKILLKVGSDLCLCLIPSGIETR
jgi:hypothetical protein